jgi:opacity protein-like surface antigen
VLMRRTLVLLVVYACCAQYAIAQTDYNKREIGGNVSIMGLDTKGAFNSDKSRDGLYGFNVQGAYNFSRYLGVKAEFSYSQRHFDTDFIDLTTRLSQIMGGIKLQDNKNTTRFRPFGHALVGVAHASDLPRIVRLNSGLDGFSVREGTGPAFALGGGLDIRLTKRLELRAFQIDYNPSRIKEETFQNVRLGIGLNFRF